jgi:hypothetical protein
MLMKKALVLGLCVLLLVVFTAGCSSVDKRIYGKWIDETGMFGYGFGTDGAGYCTFQGFTLPMVFAMKGDRLYVLLREEGDPITSEDTMEYSYTFFGDDEVVLEYPPDSGNIETYTRDTTQQ